MPRFNRFIYSGLAVYLQGKSHMNNYVSKARCRSLWELRGALWGALQAVLVVLVLPWCVASGASAQPLTLAIADLPAFGVALVAEDQGYFAAQGLELKIIHCVNGKRCLQHLTDGQAQYATVADTPLMLAALGGAKFEILATLSASARDNQFLARTDRGIRGGADLRGKRIGILTGTSAYYFADTLLLWHGIKASDVILVPLDAADPIGALVRGEVDAAALYNPFGGRALAALPQSLMKIPNPSTFSVTTNLIGITRAAGAQEANAIKLLRALKRADQFIDRDPEKARAIVAKRLRIAAPEMDALWKDYDFSISLAQPLIASLEVQSRWAMREGLVGSTKMPDYLSYVDTAPLRSVDPDAVTLVK
jgi:NitT/TauT family transport system substrate-binding protein